VSRLSRATPRRVVSTHWIGSPKSYWSGLNEAPFGTHEDNRCALRDINGDSPFTQPPLKVVEIGLQVADEQRRLA
jgi:hypothetical protein